MGKKLQEYAWNRVENAVKRAKAMHYDGCHKIYLSMDDEQVKEMKDTGYEVEKPDFKKLRGWYDESCSMRLVSAVYSGAGPKDDRVFDSLIPQFFDEGPVE